MQCKLSMFLFFFNVKNDPMIMSGRARPGRASDGALPPGAQRLRGSGAGGGEALRPDLRARGPAPRSLEGPTKPRNCGIRGTLGLSLGLGKYRMEPESRKSLETLVEFVRFKSAPWRRARSTRSSWRTGRDVVCIFFSRKLAC